MLDPGALSSVQDQGRYFLRRFGVPTSGACDSIFAACANALVGNARDLPVLEMALLGPKLEALSYPCLLALAGNCQAQITSEQGTRELPSWCAFWLQPGERLQVKIRRGYCYLAVAGGWQSRSDLGSRSSYPLAKLGAARLTKDFVLQAETITEREPLRAPPFVHQRQAIRVLLNYCVNFTTDSYATFTRCSYKISNDSNRMGLRLHGTCIEVKARQLSTATVPGSVQVPEDGQPIVLLADAQTSGGYPQIGQVISADLPRLAQASAGTELRFRTSNLQQARQAAQLLRQQFQQWQLKMTPASKAPSPMSTRSAASSPPLWLKSRPKLHDLG